VESSASSYRAERAGGARVVRTSSLPSPFAVPSLGEAQPVYPASSELTPLPHPAATAPAALATVSLGLQADGNDVGTVTSIGFTRALARVARGSSIGVDLSPPHE
jgi:hypothetical protein